MTFPLAAVLLAAVLAPQEGVEALLLQLRDGDIEERESAMTSLIALGEEIREPLKRAALGAEPELRKRIENLLKALDLEADRKKWIPTNPRVSLSGEFTLQEVAKAIEAAGGPAVRCAAWPEGRFRLDLKNVPAWEALESACEASGKASLFCENAGPVVRGNRYVDIPTHHHDELRFHVGDVGQGRSYFLEENKEGGSFQCSLHLGWSGKVGPFLAFLEVKIAADDKGNDVKAVLAGGNRSIRNAFSPDSAGVRFDLGGDHWPEAEASRIAVLSGSLILYYRASDELASLRLDVPKEEAACTIQLVDNRLVELDSWPVSFRQLVRAKEDFSCSVKFEGVDHRLQSHLFKWTVRDKDEKAYSGSAVRTQGIGDRTKSVTLEFPGVSNELALARLDSNLPKRMIRRIIPFELKDIRIR